MARRKDVLRLLRLEMDRLGAGDQPAAELANGVVTFRKDPMVLHVPEEEAMDLLDSCSDYSELFDPDVLEEMCPDGNAWLLDTSRASDPEAPEVNDGE